MKHGLPLVASLTAAISASADHGQTYASHEAQAMIALARGFVLACLLAPATILAAEAEYAIRWAQGGPNTTEAVIELLKLKGKKEVETYSIKYFDLGTTPALGSGETAIGRLRTRTDGKVELTYKTRVDASTTPTAWTCPMDGATPRTEIDVTLRQADEVRKLSRSCQREAFNQTLSFPASLQAKAKGCVNAMTRTAVRKVKIEKWDTPRGGLIEVSMPGAASTADLTKFRKLIQPLLDQGVVPLDRSKTEAGSEC